MRMRCHVFKGTQMGLKSLWNSNLKRQKTIRNVSEAVDVIPLSIPIDVKYYDEVAITYGNVKIG